MASRSLEGFMSTPGRCRGMHAYRMDIRSSLSTSSLGDYRFIASLGFTSG
jgi:hypothetical protein